MADEGKELVEEGEEKTEEQPPKRPSPPPEVPAFYSVWAEPLHYDPTLHVAMTQLAEQFEGPVFGPHVTILGAHRTIQSKAESNLKALCESTLPFTLKVTKVDSGTTYFQCVYLLVDKTQEVVDAHVQALGCFNELKAGSNINEIREKYMPHMSLLYCHMTDEQLELAKAKVEAEHGRILIGKEYTVKHLSLYLTDVDDESCVSWKKVAEFPLREPEKAIWAQ